MLEEAIDNLQVRRESSVTFLRAGHSKPGYAHILSFRRQLYIHADDETKIPESMKIIHEGITYWIYLTIDTLKCFVCNNTGHIAKNCQQNRQQQQNFGTNMKSNTITATQSTSENSLSIHNTTNSIDTDNEKLNAASTTNVESNVNKFLNTESEEENVTVPIKRTRSRISENSNSAKSDP